MTELDVLDKVELSSGKKEKESLLELTYPSSKMFDLLNAALNFKEKFFIKKFDVGTPVDTTVDKHDEFMHLLFLLKSQLIRGDRAKATVEEFILTLSAQQQKWYTRIIKKNLQAGFSLSTAAKAGFNIPKFDVMLAKDSKSCKDLRKVVSKGGFLSRKLDGYRCLAEVSEGEVTLYSRNGTSYLNFKSIADSLSVMFPTGTYVLDGEIMSDDFQSMQQSAFSIKSNKVVGDVKYHIFDMIPYQEWTSGEFKLPKSKRVENLEYLFHHLYIPDNICYVNQHYTNSLDVVVKLENQFFLEGYEGAMFVPDIPYYLGKKSNKMLKFKSSIMKTQDVEIVDFYNGKPGTKYENTLGGVVVRQEDGILCDCGSGFKDQDRDYIFSNKDHFRGKIFEACYQELGSNGRMRFPSFRRWRNDKIKL